MYKVAIVTRVLCHSSEYGSFKYLKSVVDFFKLTGFKVIYVYIGRTCGFNVGEFSKVYRECRVSPIEPFLPVYSYIICSLLNRIVKVGRFFRCKCVDRAVKFLVDIAPQSGIECGDRRVLNGREIDFVRRVIRKHRPQIVVADHTWMANIFDSDFTECLKVILTHDILFKRRRSFWSIGMESDCEVWDKDFEKALLQKGDVIVTIQDHERQVVKKLLPEKKVISVPYPVDVKLVKGRPKKDNIVIFVGSNADHNVISLQWYLREIWPKVLERIPDALMYVVGSIGSRKIFQNWGDKTVRFLGYVDDIDSYYEMSKVAVIPSIVSSGLKIKLVEALSYGVPCVASENALVGVGELKDEVVLCARDSKQFAGCVVDLLIDGELADRLKQNSIDYVRKNLTREVVFEPLREVIDDYLGAGGKGNG
ncbi:MAG: glycosyltransferase family 4 protein [Candidatus Marinimicrobia bacterium]|nr:glycosyltransferase family 4 protein [Candidatus Neomarinimicrobiota bacterium]